jgi:Subtilase family/LGFP repeat
MTQIQDKFDALQQQGFDLGKTVGSEELLPDGGSVQRYDLGAIYFHPRAGEAFECHGLILDTYVALGEQSSALGYPMSDEFDDPNVLLGRLNVFEGGSLLFDPEVGVTPQFEDIPVSPQVVVKFLDELPLQLEQGAELGLDEIGVALGLGDGDPFIEAVRLVLPDIAFRRLFDCLPPEDITALVKEAQKVDPDYAPPSFEHYLAITCPDDFDTAPLVDALRFGKGLVEDAYAAPLASDPGVVVATNNPLFFSQRHLTAINVRKAWDRGADGSATRFIDIERGWLPKHQDLPPLQLLGGHNSFASYGHGTAVLGVIAGLDNLVGIVGIAPQTNASVISYVNPAHRTGSTREEHALANAILLAISKLGSGDVLLLEEEPVFAFEGGPGHPANGAPTELAAEAEEPVYQMILLATNRGITVVEAAGNGNADLDTYVPGGRAILSRSGAGTRPDSGAIMVGACTTGNQRWTFIGASGRTFGSNFGSRVDCCAWGEQIVTTGDRDPPFREDGYLAGPAPAFFSGTSGAAAIIAGVCLLIQDLAAASGGKLPPRVVRAMLGNPHNGTSVPTVGPLPNLGNIVRNHFP